MAASRKRKTPERKTRIFVVDDHPLIRQGLIQLLGEQENMEVCGEAGSGIEAAAAIDELKPDLAIVDLSLKDMNGLDLIRDMSGKQPGLSVLVLSMHEELFYAERALRIGAKGYIMKGGPLEEVLTAIRRVLDGDVYLSDKMTSRIMHRLVGGQSAEPATPMDLLTDRQLRVFILTGEGHGPSEIAEKLHLSVKTIETYRSRIKEKLDLSSATELRRHAIHWVQNCDLK